MKGQKSSIKAEKPLVPQTRKELINNALVKLQEHVCKTFNESLEVDSCVLLFHKNELKRVGSEKGKQIISNPSILNHIYAEM